MFIFFQNPSAGNGASAYMAAKPEIEKFQFLEKLALELGASEAKVIPASEVIVEDRVVLKCKVGCTNYGKTLCCPPYTPTAEEFRKIVSEYTAAMFIKFICKAEADPELQKNLAKSQTDVPLDAEVKAKAEKFWADWKEDKTRQLETTVALEKAAMKAGYPLAISFVSGACNLCEKCNLETKICRHPEKARLSEDAIGVNVRKTAKNASIEYKFPFDKNPATFALLLID
jgi:predicted metal-binding protein